MVNSCLALLLHCLDEPRAPRVLRSCASRDVQPQSKHCKHPDADAAAACKRVLWLLLAQHSCFTASSTDNTSASTDIPGRASGSSHLTAQCDVRFVNFACCLSSRGLLWQLLDPGILSRAVIHNSCGPTAQRKAGFACMVDVMSWGRDSHSICSDHPCAKTIIGSGPSRSHLGFSGSVRNRARGELHEFSRRGLELPA